MGVSEIWPLNILLCWGLLLATVAAHSLIICQTAPLATFDVCILTAVHHESVFGWFIELSYRLLSMLWGSFISELLIVLWYHL
jgi:hypothetical protein